MKPFYRYLYFWVLAAILSGGFFGYFCPEQAQELKFLGDAFINLIKMLIAPLIFCSVALGIAGATDAKKVGRVGLKAFVYFEIVSTLALVIGLAVAHFLKPGESFHVDITTLDSSAVSDIAQKARETSVFSFFLHLIPKTYFEPLTSSGDILQVLLVAVLFGFAILSLSSSHQNFLRVGLESLREVFFTLISKIMLLAPIGAGAAMAFTVGKYGVASLRPLLFLMVCFYLTCTLFVVGVLGFIAKRVGFNILHFLRYLSQDIFLVLGTSSSESALGSLMKKLEKLGCSQSVVGLVVPAGYSFNLDGTNIYLTLACLFVAQALSIHLSLAQELSILAIAMISSKGASGVTGAGFIALAATLSVVPEVPVVGLTLVLGVDRFMSEARAITNMIGNGVATLVIANWEGELDHVQLKRELARSGRPD